MIQEFHLSPPGTGRGLSCDANGAFIGSIPLLKRSAIDGRERWEPRECGELSKAIGESFRLPIDMSSKMGGVRAISNALNEGDIARAQIATVLLGIPDQPALSKGVDNRGELIKFIHALHRSGLLKADWDPDEHPRWPAGAPDSQGGQFAPKGDETTVGQTIGDAAPTRSSRGVASDIGISPRDRFYGADVPSSVQPALQVDNQGINSFLDGSRQPPANDAEDLGIYSSYGRHIGDVQVASTAAVAPDGLSIGAAQRANWANLTRLANGALRLGSGQIITAAALLTAADMQRERAAVDAAINKFGLDSKNAADVLAIRAYVWAQHFAPMNQFGPRNNLDVPWSGPQLESVSQSIMALELARPGTLYLATQGDEPSKKYLDVAVEAGLRGGSIVESRRPENLPAQLQTSTSAARAALNLRPNNQMQAHHLIPANVWAAFLRIATPASKAGWHPDLRENLIALPANEATQEKLAAAGLELPIHSSSHSNYDLRTAGELIEESLRYDSTLTPKDARALFKKVEERMEELIRTGTWMPRLR